MIIFNNNSIGYVLDTDASKVIEAVRSTGVTITPAMMHYAHYLISNMKNIGTWQLSNAVYGFVGGTADSHKWNWKDLRDVDAAFRLTYGGTVTHSVNGMLSDGTTGYADTKLIQDNLGLTVNNNHLSFFSGTSAQSGASQIYDMGQGTFTGNILSALFLRRNNNTSAFDSGNFLNNRNSVTSANGAGYFLGKINTDLTSKFYKNGLLLGTKAITNQANLGQVNVYLCAFNETTGTRYYSNKQCRFSTIGSGLTDTQATQQSQIVTNAQQILNRA